MTQTPCRYCGRTVSTPCKNTRDMDPVDGFNNDADCNRALDQLGGGERGFRLPETASEADQHPQ